MIEIQPPLDRAVLVAAPLRGSDDARQAEEHLDELARLTNTAGAEVIGRMMQRIAKVSPKLLIGRGKLGELEELVAARDATLVIFDQELSPVQGKNLEDGLGVRVMDRSEVILDIFATRARTTESKMQVELAQLEYTLPRLARMWSHLSRIRGGIGLRGPGEPRRSSSPINTWGVTSDTSSSRSRSRRWRSGILLKPVAGSTPRSSHARGSCSGKVTARCTRHSCRRMSTSCASAIPVPKGPSKCAATSDCERVAAAVKIQAMATDRVPSRPGP